VFKKHEFDVEAFYKLGEWLSTQNPNVDGCSNMQEGIYRAVIGRYYYYTFLKIRNIILFYDENNSTSLNGMGAHGLILSYLNALDDILGLDGELQDIAKGLGELRNLRNDADYKTNKEITIDDVNRAKGWVEYIETSLKSIEFEGKVGFEDILDYIKLVATQNRRMSQSVRFPKLKRNNKNIYYFE
jgi:uncharacterized protein (UPF0332 family)